MLYSGVDLHRRVIVVCMIDEAFWGFTEVTSKIQFQ